MHYLLVHYDGEMCEMTKRLGILIISVDYRRSPEYPFPIPVDDCENVYLKIVHNEYKRYMIDPNKICLMGDSAGGNICAVIAQRQLRKKFVQPKVIIYIHIPKVIHPCTTEKIF